MLPAAIREFLSNPHLGLIDLIKMNIAPELAASRADVAEYRNAIESTFADFLYISELNKNAANAATCRKTGNRAYRQKEYTAALESYNESIGFAEVGSEELGMAYANRSVVYYDQGEYEFALYNIALAKKHNYPERLMPKLLAREEKCRWKLATGLAKSTVPKLRMGINVDVNPEIPFLAAGIGMKQYPGFGRGLFAKKNFNPGDIILDQKPDLCALDFTHNFSYQYCFHCGSEFHLSLIPCSKCDNFMYCSVECLEKDWKQAHRFECPVAMKLFLISLSSTTFGKMAGRLFFYGLTHFGDNVQRMMTWCEENVETGCDPFELDHIDHDPLKLFKMLHNTNVKPDPANEHDLKISVACYYLIYLKSPLVQSIFRKRAHRNFMLRCLLNLARVTWTLRSDMPQPSGVSTLSAIASLCNHSCDPNALTVIHSGRIKMVLLRPVREGAQIFTSYGRYWWDPVLNEYALLKFTCQCVVCGNHPPSVKWHTALRRPEIPKQILEEASAVAKLGDRPTVCETVKLDAMRKFIRRYARVYPLPQIGEVVRIYGGLLTDAIHAENETLERAKVRVLLSDD